MALIHIDGFDHYGDDETKMTEGIYDQVDAPFSLSTLNPRTGNKCLRRDNSASEGYVIKSFDSTDALGSGACFYLSQLPSNENSYVVFDILYNDTSQVSIIVQSDGSLLVKIGGIDGIPVASTEPGIIQAGEFFHLEFAVSADTFDTSQGLLSVKRYSNWKYLVEPNTSTNDYSDPDFDDSSWETSQAPFYDKQPHPYLPGLGWEEFNTQISLDTIVWMRRTIFLAQESTLAFELAHDNVPNLYVDGSPISLTPGPVVDTQNWTSSASITLSSGNHVIAYSVRDDIPTGPEDFEFADLEILITNISTTENGGIFEIRKNGVTVLSESDILTTIVTDKLYNKIRLACGSSITHGVTTDIDDWYVWNTDGAWNNSFIGDRRCFLLKPNQDTNIADFDPSSGSFGYKMIDDESPDDDATYIIAEAYLQSGSPITGTSEFEIENAPDGTSMVSAVNVISRASKTDSTSAEIYTSIRSGSNSVSGQAHILTTSYGYFSDIYEYDPSTISSMTKQNIDDLSISVTADDLEFETIFAESPDVVSPSFVSPTDEPQYLIDFSVDLDGSTEYFSRTFSGGNRRIFTYSFWYKNNSDGAFQVLLSRNNSGSQDWTGFTDLNQYRYLFNGSTIVFDTTDAFTSTTEWKNVVLAFDTTQATASDRFKLYIDGVQITDFDTVNYPSLNQNMNINSNGLTYFGRLASSNILHMSAKIADFHFIDGQALTAEDFGVFFGGDWQPIEYTGSYGTTGFFLNFSNSSNLGEDMAQSNDWTGTNISAADQSTDTPTS